VLFTFFTEIESVKLLFIYLLILLYIGNHVAFVGKLFVSYDQIFCPSYMNTILICLSIRNGTIRLSYRILVGRYGALGIDYNGTCAVTSKKLDNQCR
jgi:hypothetical protein